MRNVRCCLALAIGSALCWAQTSQIMAQQQQTIASSGDAAGGNGTFETFEDTFMNDRGDVSFFSRLSGTSQSGRDNKGIYTKFFGTNIQEQARAGDIAEGSLRYSVIQQLGLNNRGQSLFRSTLLGTTSGFSSAIYRADENGLHTQLAREGDSAPIDGRIGEMPSSVTHVSFNDNGNLVFRNVLTDISSFSNDSILSSNDGSISLVAQEGFVPPDGVGNYRAFASITAMNNRDEVAFIGSASSSSGVYLRNTETNPIAVTGDPSPSGNGTLHLFSNGLATNESGQVAFEGRMSGTANGNQDSEAVFRGDGDSLIEVMREGTTVFGGGVFNSSFSSSIRINESGQVSFSAGLRETSGGSNDDSGIYRSSASGFSLTEVAREGQAIDTGDGVLASIGTSNLAMNELGHVAFQSDVTGTTNDAGIFIGDGTDLLTVAQKGQLLNGKTISEVSFSGGTHSNGLDNDGQIAYSVGFTDGSEAVQLWTPDLHWRKTFSSAWDIDDRWTLGISPDALYDTFIDPDASVTVQGPSSNTTVKSFTIGGGNGIATFRMANGTTLTAANGTTIHSTGVLTGDGTIAGSVNNQGVIQAQNVLVVGSISNNGVIRGNGRIHSSKLVNSSVGEIRVRNGETLELTGSSLTNSGRIEVIEGELSVNAVVQNTAGTGLIVGRDATMRFNGGLENQGSLGISFGTSDIFGDINNDGGTISISGGANVTFYDDVIQNGTLQVVSVGSSSSAAVFFGELSGSGGFVGGGDVYALGDLRPGNSPASVLMDGNLFLGASTNSLFEFSGLTQGEYDQLLITGDLSLAGNLIVDFIDDFELGFSQQFLLADVGGSLTGQFMGLNEGSTVGNFGGIDLFISYQGGDGNDVLLFSAIPEPCSASVLLVGMLGLLAKRRRQIV